MSKKLEIIFTYYKGVIIGAVFAVAFVAWLIWHFGFDKQDVTFTCCVVNSYLAEDDAVLTFKLEEHLGFTGKKEKAYFDTGYQIPYPGAINNASDVSFYDKFFLGIRVGTTDVAIMPRGFFEYCIETDRIFYDVGDVLLPEDFTRYQNEGRLEEAADPEDGSMYVAGIDVTDFSFWESEDFCFVGSDEGDDIILAFPVNAKNKDLCRTFMGFIE